MKQLNIYQIDKQKLLDYRVKSLYYIKGVVVICNGLTIGKNENYLVLIEEDIVVYTYSISLANIAHFLIVIQYPTTKIDKAIEEASQLII